MVLSISEETTNLRLSPENERQVSFEEYLAAYGAQGQPNAEPLRRCYGRISSCLDQIEDFVIRSFQEGTSFSPYRSRSSSTSTSPNQITDRIVLEINFTSPIRMSPRPVRNRAEGNRAEGEGVESLIQDIDEMMRPAQERQENRLISRNIPDFRQAVAQHTTETFLSTYPESATRTQARAEYDFLGVRIFIERFFENTQI